MCCSANWGVNTFSGPANLGSANRACRTYCSDRNVVSVPSSMDSMWVLSIWNVARDWRAEFFIVFCFPFLVKMDCWCPWRGCRSLGNQAPECGHSLGAPPPPFHLWGTMLFSVVCFEVKRTGQGWPRLRGSGRPSEYGCLQLRVWGRACQCHPSLKILLETSCCRIGCWFPSISTTLACRRVRVEGFQIPFTTLIAAARVESKGIWEAVLGVTERGGRFAGGGKL